MRVRILGCGDAFGSGGRLNTCFFIDAGVGILLDCGASALSAMKRHGLDGNRIDVIVLTHLHGDHFAGIPFLVRETQIAAARTKPLTIVGPPGHERVIRETMELLFPGSPNRLDTFDLVFREYSTTEPLEIGTLSVRAMAVQHTSATNPHAVRLTTEGRTVVYSGDTAWLDSLVDFAAEADLFLCECYQLEALKPNHVDLESLRAHMQTLTCRRLVLTHMGDEILALPNGPDVPERAFDGMEISLALDTR
jgi:ribonuclease BN (tRNA processing enzyme)